MALLLAGTGASSQAQLVRGIVRDSATADPVAGAVAAVVDSAGVTLARTLSDAAGRFMLPISARAAVIRLIHIGYQPRDVALTSLAREGTIQVVMRRLPTTLNAVRVSERELCPASTDRGDAFRLWGEARDGLLATAVAREASMKATVLTFQRSLGPTDDRIRRQEARAKTGAVPRPFEAAAPASTFAQTGYMQEGPAGRTFFAPDADVLLDPSFAATHCFNVREPDKEHAGQVGLTFAPIPGRDSLVDVVGVVWMAVATPELRSLDFQYTGLEPVAITARSGGHLEFRTTANGVAFIEHWSVRLPVLTPMLAGPAMPRASTEHQRRQDRHDLRVNEILETGGEVLAVSWRDGTDWRATTTAVTGTILQRGLRAPLPNAVVSLVGTADTAVTNARGEFRLDPVLPGKYVVMASDTTMAAYVAARSTSQAIDIGRGTIATLNVELPSVPDVLAGLCGDDNIRRHTAAIVGRVTLSGAVVNHATIRAEWQADYNHGSVINIVTDAAGNSSAGGPLRISGMTQAVDLDGAGRFTVCGAATGRPIHLRFLQGTSFADTTVFAQDSVIKTVEWHATPHFLAASSSAASAAFAGTVMRGQSDAPLIGADVWLPGADQRTQTDSTGGFRFDSLPSGFQIIQVRHIGFEAIRDTLTLARGGTTLRRYALTPQTAQLDAVRTVAAGEKYRSPQLQEFEHRRVSGNGGEFVSDSILRENQNSLLSNIISARVPGLAWAATQRGFLSTRTRCRNGQLLRPCTAPDCFVAVYLDGVQLYSASIAGPTTPPPDLSRMNASDIAGIEFYVGGASAPAGMAVPDGGCGSLWLWSRER